jgi:CheY-like chemotaxis protein
MAQPGSRHNVLYIEDNAANVRLMERIFERRTDLRLLVATSGVAGLDIAHSQRPSVVLLDMHLPDMKGEDVLARLRGDQLTADIPVIVVSADAIDRNIQHMLQAGAATYVTKPFDALHLLQLVEELVRDFGTSGVAGD